MRVPLALCVLVLLSSACAGAATDDAGRSAPATGADAARDRLSQHDSTHSFVVRGDRGPSRACTCRRTARHASAWKTPARACQRLGAALLARAPPCPLPRTWLTHLARSWRYVVGADWSRARRHLGRRSARRRQRSDAGSGAGESVSRCATRGSAAGAARAGGRRRGGAERCCGPRGGQRRSHAACRAAGVAALRGAHVCLFAAAAAATERGDQLERSSDTATAACAAKHAEAVKLAASERGATGAAATKSTTGACVCTKHVRS
jgi:hypothetical protein